MMNKYLIFTSMFLLLSLSSCQLWDMETVPQRLTEEEIGNPHNEWEEVGRIHNDLLGYIQSRQPVLFPGESLDADQLIQIVLAYQQDRPDALTEDAIRLMVDQLYGILASGSAIKASTVDPCKIAPSFCDPGTPPFYPSLPTFDFAIATEEALQNRENALQQVRAIRDAEQNWQADSLRQMEPLAMAYFSTYRWSTQFWYNALNLTTDPIFQDQTRVCVSCEVIEADAAGAALGGWLGPIGAGVGAATASAIVYAELTSN